MISISDCSEKTSATIQLKKTSATKEQKDLFTDSSEEILEVQDEISVINILNENNEEITFGENDNEVVLNNLIPDSSAKEAATDISGMAESSQSLETPDLYFLR